MAIYLHEVGRAYALAVPVSICFNVVFFTMLGSPPPSVKLLKQFAAGATVAFWLLAGTITAIYVSLPFGLAFWCVSTICCALAAALAAAELCAKGADLIGLL